MYNKIIVMGRICSDPELKTTPNGVNVCTFRIAVDRRFQQKGEDRKTDFFNVVAWRSAGELVSKYFGKGRMILVEGELQTRPYTDKSGNQSTWYEINAERVSFTGEKSGNTPTADTAPAAPQTAQNASPEAPAAAPVADFSGAGSDPYPF